MSQREVVLISHRGRSNAAPSCNRTRACEVRRAAAAPPSAKVSQLLQRQLKAPDATGSWTLAGQFPLYIDGQISLDVAAIVDRRSPNSYTWPSSQEIQVEPVGPHSLLPRAYHAALAASADTITPRRGRPRTYLELGPTPRTAVAVLADSLKRRMGHVTNRSTQFTDRRSASNERLARIRLHR